MGYNYTGLVTNEYCYEYFCGSVRLTNEYFCGPVVDLRPSVPVDTFALINNADNA